MSVLVEGISVIIRNSIIDKNYKGGVSKYAQDCLNGTFCTDGQIARVGFMAPPDVGRFVMGLEKQGFVFTQHNKAIDIAVIDQVQGFTVSCEWLIFQRTPEGVAFCAVKGMETNNIAVPNGWNFENSLSNKFTKVDNKDVDVRLQYLRTEGNVDVFLDKQTTKEVYMGRTSEANHGITSVADIFKKGVELVDPYIFISDRKASKIESAEDNDKIKRGIEYLELVVQLETQHWAAYWLLGKTQQTLQNAEKAYSNFKSAFSINPSHPDVCRELMMECLQLGKTEEGIEVAKTAVKIDSNDPGLLANLGLALFLNANLDEAKRTAEKALAQAPSDPITRNLLMMITQVQNGKRPQPRKISDLMEAG
jgi:tetratricopeptide (TPR) repeat protein